MRYDYEKLEKRHSTGGKPHRFDDSFWSVFCLDCCYRSGSVCEESGLAAGMIRKDFLPAFEQCSLWPKVKAKIAETRRVFKYTFEGSMRVTYSFQVRFSKTRDPVRYGMHYTYDEFRERLIELGYKKVWLKWARSGFEAGLRPVVRRRRRKEGYTIKNIFLGG